MHTLIDERGARAASRPSESAPRLEGILRLTFRAREGRTYLAEQYDQAPLKVVRPFDLDDGRVVLQVMNVTAGVLAGDAYRIEIRVGPAAKVVLVNQTATKVFGAAPGAYSTEEVHVEVETGGELEYYPGLVIPFPRADFRQTLRVHLAPGARFGFLEFRAMGRIERGEYLAFRRLSARVRVCQNGLPLYNDALEIEPGRLNVAGWGLLEGHRYLASGYWCWAERLEHQSIDSPEMMVIAGSPAKGHLYLRGLAHDGMALRKAVGDILARQRAAWDLPPLSLGRYAGSVGPAD